MNTARLLGRNTALAGVIEEIMLGTNLSFSGTTLNAASGGVTDADFLVRTTHAGLSAERVVTDTTTISWDWATAGQAKASVANTVPLLASANVFSANQSINIASLAESKLTIGETTTLRGDAQDAALILYGEQTGVINSATIRYTGTNLSIVSTFASAAAQFGILTEVLSGKGLRVRDAGNTDFLAFNHNGTDATIVGTNTANVVFSGVTSVNAPLFEATNGYIQITAASGTA